MTSGTLGLYNNRITDLTPLAELKNLGELLINNNQISDLSPLEGLTKLELLDLKDNPALTKRQIEELQKALPKCRISHNATK